MGFPTVGGGEPAAEEGGETVTGEKALSLVADPLSEDETRRTASPALCFSGWGEWRMEGEGMRGVWEVEVTPGVSPLLRRMPC